MEVHVGPNHGSMRVTALMCAACSGNLAALVLVLRTGQTLLSVARWAKMLFDCKLPQCKLQGC